jgi:hypothetical protein
MNGFTSDHNPYPEYVCTASDATSLVYISHVSHISASKRTLVGVEGAQKRFRRILQPSTRIRGVSET